MRVDLVSIVSAINRRIERNSSTIPWKGCLNNVRFVGFRLGYKPVEYRSSLIVLGIIWSNGEVHAN